MGRPKGVTNQPVAGRLGCKYADQYYAEQFGITQNEARDVYRCSTGWKAEEVGAPICPFGFLKECIVDMDSDYREGVVTGLLNAKTITCHLLPISYESSYIAQKPGYVHYECSNCKGTIKGDTEFMKFCYNCGARVE